MVIRRGGGSPVRARHLPPVQGILNCRQIVIENDTNKWKGNSDERNSDSASGRNDHAAENNPRSIGPAAEAIFRDVRSRDTGKPLDASDALSGGAALSAVAAGRKPLYHEEWGQELGSDLARRLWGLDLPGVQITLADDGHLFAYRPEIIQSIIDADPAAYPGPTLFGLGLPPVQGILNLNGYMTANGPCLGLPPVQGILNWWR